MGKKYGLKNNFFNTSKTIHQQVPAFLLLNGENNQEAQDFTKMSLEDLRRYCRILEFKHWNFLIRFQNVDQFVSLKNN